MGFIQDKKRGKLGESVVKAYFLQEGYEVEDTSEDELFQTEDVDLLVADSIKYEVKTDYMFSRTGNFALEDSYTNFYGKVKSWLWTSKADRFAFVDAHNTEEFYCIDASTLRELVRLEHLPQTIHDDGYKIIHLYLLPFGKYKELFEVCRLGGAFNG